MPKEFDLRKDVPSAPKGQERKALYVEALREPLITAGLNTRERDRKYSHGELVRRTDTDLLHRQADALHRLNELGKLAEVEIFYEEQLTANGVVYGKNRSKRKNSGRRGR